ncbi:hypothetical protein [Corallococcus sp. RDP092CA]|uniref:hypothetical protein n=1 Tax=Corallococcus sp. RDP092CA TaxID=3109369 RepID=UPI0035B2D9C0
MRKRRETGTALMNAREMRLVLASAPRNLMELSRRELMGMVRRARGLVVQYEKLTHRLRREAMRVPMGSRVVGGRMDTRRKAALFRAALSRFESQLRRMERTPARKARPVMRKRPAAKKALRPMARATAPRKKAVTAKKAMRPAGYARRGPVKARAHKARRMPAMKARAHRSPKARTPARRAATR